MVQNEGLLHSFKLLSKISVNNMHAFDAHGNIRKYNHPEEILNEHFEVRKQLYTKRKHLLMLQYAAEEIEAGNKYNFIRSILKGDINLIGQYL